MDEFNEIYEDWIDSINATPLTSSRINEYGDVIQLNQQIISRIYSIRRYLEIDEMDSDQGDRIDQMPLSNASIQSRLNEINRLVRSNRNTSMQSDLVNNIVGNMFSNMFNRSVNNPDTIFGSRMVTDLFSILLEEANINAENFQDVKVTLSEDQFGKLKKDVITQENKDTYKSECNICMDEYNIGDKVVQLGCKHVFHEDCIRHWLCNERVTCPVCRKDTREDLEVDFVN
jgi:hypothetical protein